MTCSAYMFVTVCRRICYLSWLHPALFRVSASISCLCFFFFQAEDGIRDDLVTGVQTCALPISWELPADQPVFRTDANSLVAHAQLLAKAKQAGIDVYFEGDSITRRWGAVDYPDLLANWKQNFFGWNAADFGWGGDRTQNILWRLENGELDGVNPKVVVLLAGINNVGDLSISGAVRAS